MGKLSCFGRFDRDNSQCIKCDDKGCKHIFDLKMECDKRCRKDVAKCELWDTEHCILRQ